MINSKCFGSFTFHLLEGGRERERGERGGGEREGGRGRRREGESLLEKDKTRLKNH